MIVLRVLSLGLLTLILAQAGCGGSEAAGTPGETIQGRVLDVEGKALSGVKVTLGKTEAESNSKGEYTLKADKSGTLRFQKSGYVAGYERVELEDFTVALDAVLLKRGPKVTIDAEAGGEVEGARGSHVTIPAGAIVDEDGNSIEGDVDVYLTPIDPSIPAELQAAPGAFVATENGDTTILESFGMVDITIEQDGKELNVKDGEVFSALIPPPANVTEPPETMPLYSFDEEKGIWVLEGEATFNAESGAYEAEIPHLSAWNCDQPLEATCESGKVVDKDGKPIPGARVRGSGVSYTGQSEAVTNEKGEFVLAVRKDSEVNIIAEHPRGGGKVRRVQSGNAGTAIPPEAGSDDCKDGGEWIIEEGVVEGPDGTKKDCDDINDVFSGNECLTDFGKAMGSCKAEFSGKCTIEVSESGSISTAYADGSKMVQTASGSAVYGPDGELCYEMGVDVSDDVSRIKYTFDDGKAYEMEVSGGSDWTLNCPSGESLKITQEQNDALAACQPDTSEGSGEGGASGSETCEVILPETGSGGSSSSGGGSSGGSSSGGRSSSGGSDGSGGALTPGYCENDDDCSGGTVCCDLGTILYCLDEVTCSAVPPSDG